MESLIQLDSFAIQSTLPILLKDRTTKKNIIWATNNYQDGYGNDYEERDEITVESLKGLNSIDIQPRVLKTLEAQKSRTKKRAEVFTPSWICNLMNNSCDEQWFGRPDVFNTLADNNDWIVKTEKIEFPKTKRKSWQKYVLSRRIEITCGEAPYLVSRYDTTTGELICIPKRIGMLDRKLRIINENVCSEEEWFEWVTKAYQSTYGYEFQGDNLLIARMNLILTFVDYMKYKWEKNPSEEQLKKIATIISWNIWQMDGLTYEVPLGGPLDETPQQMTIDDLTGQTNFSKDEKLYVKIRNWRNGNTVRTIYFKDLRKESR